MESKQEMKNHSAKTNTKKNWRHRKPCHQSQRDWHNVLRERPGLWNTSLGIGNRVPKQLAHLKMLVSPWKGGLESITCLAACYRSYQFPFGILVTIQFFPAGKWSGKQAHACGLEVGQILRICLVLVRKKLQLFLYLVVSGSPSEHYPISGTLHSKKALWFGLGVGGVPLHWTKANSDQISLIAQAIGERMSGQEMRPQGKQ